MSKPETYASVWDAIADTLEQAADLKARADLMRKIAARLKEHDWTQAEAASRCGVTQPRINDLLRGRLCGRNPANFLELRTRVLLTVLAESRIGGAPLLRHRNEPLSNQQRPSLRRSKLKMQMTVPATMADEHAASSAI